MEKYSRVIELCGRSFHCSKTMGDIFLAHAADLAARGVTELVSLVHEGGVDQLMVGPATRITVTESLARVEPPTPITGMPTISAA